MFPGRKSRLSVAVSIYFAFTAASLFVSASHAADDLAFRRHVINPDSEFMSAAVFDVNKDGKLDIVCGGFWYEGPDFTKKHFLRNVELRGGRPDGYAHQVLDVNGDGWPDLVTVNWRTSSLKWIEHPGPALSKGEEWKAHTIAVPGPSETGRLVDLLGDRTPVILPCGSNFAAWWELKRTTAPAAPEWIRHDLPRELAGHGLGWGDINGDGRMDLVGHAGWAEAPVDRRKDRWIWHADFELDQASIPVLVVDVDGDGLNDIVYTRGHDFGIYWLQQSRGADGKISWTKHAIDTTVPGAHAPLWEDLDGDGVPELIVGRRYLAHEGRDPAEYDPLSGYRYQFDRQTRIWKRWLISYDDGVCFGLDPKAVDLTGSGRKDLVLAGRHGLYRLENLGKGSSVAMKLTKDPLSHPAYSDHQNLLIVKDESGQTKPVANAFDWGRRRAHILAAMQDVFGVLPDSSQRPPLEEKSRSFTGRLPSGVAMLKSFASDGQSRVSVRLVIPINLKRNAGAVICLQNGPHDETLSCVNDLVKRGYVCLIPDYPSEKEYKNAADMYVSGCMKVVWDSIRCIDFLETIPEISYRKIAILGHRQAGLHALLTAAFDSRVAAVVSSVGFTNFADSKPEDFATWSKPSMAPRIHNQFADDPKKIPFDFAELLGTLAPRPALVIASEKNSGIEGIRKSCTSAADVYQMKKAPTAFKTLTPADEGLSESTRNEIYTWLDQKLKR